MQTLEFELTREDWRAYLSYSAPRWWDMSGGWVVVVTLFIGGAVGVFEASAEIHVDRYLFVALLLGLVVLLSKARELIKRRMRLARWKPPAGPTRLTVSNAGLAVAQADAQRAVAWNLVHEVVVQDGFVFLAAINEDDRILIPMRAFADRDAMLRFAAACEAGIKADEERRERGAGTLGEAGANNQETQTPVPDHPHIADIALKGEDWPAVNADLNRNKKTLTFAQSAAAITLIGGVISGGLSAIYTNLAGRPLDFATYAAFGWPGAVVMAFLGGHAYDKAQRKLLDANAAQSSNYQITLDADGVTRRAQGVQVHLDWSAITRLELRGECILFGTPWNEMFIAPKHSFAQVERFWSFLSAARSWRSAAQQAAASEPKPDAAARPIYAIRSEPLKADVRSVDVGAPDAGRAQPDEMIFIDRDGQPFLRVNVFYPPQDYHSRTGVEIWRDWLVVGFGARVALVSLSGDARRSLALSETEPPDSLDYFCQIEATPSYLFVSSGRRVFRLGEDGETLWKSVEVGLDGVLVWSDDDAGIVHGSGEWDPPGGWRDFRLAIETGLQIP